MAPTGITPSTLAHDLVLAVSSKGLWLEAGSSFHHEDPREHRRSAQALCDLWARRQRGDYCGWVRRWPLPQSDHNEIICYARILGLLPGRLIPFYFLHLLLTEAVFLAKFTGISQLPCCFILFVI